MKEGAADIADALLPPEDGAVTHALSDLKAKLSTWSTAVANVQVALAAQAAKLAERDSAQQHEPGSTAPQPDSTEALHEGAEQRGSEDGSNERDAAVSVAEPTVESLEAQDDEYQSQAYAKEVSPTEEGDDGPTAPALTLSEPVKGSRGTVQYQAGEDQALLESLDEKMAKSIRVQFRLFDGRKSIRELINEYVEEPEEQQKSWWQRVKG